MTAMSVMQLPGIFDLPADVYHADPCERPSLSQSIAKELLGRSPRHAWTAHPRLNPDFVRRHDDKFDLGTCVHRLILEGQDVEDAVEIVDAPDWRTKAARETRDAARADGKTPLLSRDVGRVIAMLDAARDQLSMFDVDLLKNGAPEQTLIWEENGVMCRALVDWLHDDHAAIDDLKTTSATANPEWWTRRQLFGMGYDIQAAFYLRGLKAITGKDAEFRFVVQETFPPYALSVISVGPAVLSLANEKVTKAIETWRDCLAADEWPAFPTQICYAELPPWAEAEWLEKEEREAS